MSIVLLCGALYGAMRAAMLCFIPANRAANRLLAALIAVLALFTFPYIIGYAGYYDAYPWLSFFPYNLTLAIGPLLYPYLACVFDGGAQPPPAMGPAPDAGPGQALYSDPFAQPLAFRLTGGGQGSFTLCRSRGDPRAAGIADGVLDAGVAPLPPRRRHLA